jgi:hypothetical protein
VSVSGLSQQAIPMCPSIVGSSSPRKLFFISKTKFSGKKPFFQACLWSIDQRLTFGFGKSENKLQFKVLEFAEQVLDAALGGLHEAGSPVWGVGLEMGFHFSHEAFDVYLEFTLFQSHWGHAESIDNGVNSLIAIIDIVNWHGITDVVFGCTFSDHFRFALEHVAIILLNAVEGVGDQF